MIAVSCRLLAKLTPLLVLLAVGACAEPAPSRSERAAPAAGAAAPPPAAPPLLNARPDASRYLKQGADDSQVQADVEDCYTFARAVVEHDQRIEDDRETVIEGSETRSETAMFRERMEAFGDRSTYLRRFDSCMRAKGYERQ